MLRHLIRISVVAVAAMTAMLGCSSSKDMPKTQDTDQAVQLPDDYPPPPAASPDGVTYTWGRSEIALEVYSTSHLNVYDDRTHNLMVCLYQLSDLTDIDRKINEITDSSHRSLEELLQCESFAQSVISASRFFIRPRMHTVIKFDREKDVKHVVLVAGYNSTISTENIISTKIPLYYSRDGLIFKDDQYSVAPLKKRIFFGKDRMADLKNGEKFTDFMDEEGQQKLNRDLDAVIIDGDTLLPIDNGQQAPVEETQAQTAAAATPATQSDPPAQTEPQAEKPSRANSKDIELSPTQADATTKSDPDRQQSGS